MKKIIPVVTTALAFVVAFTATAHAAAAVEPTGGTLLNLLTPIYQAFLAGHDMLAGALALVCAVALVRRYGTASLPWLSTDAGSASLVMIGSFGTAMVATLATGTAATWTMAYHALALAFVSMGGYTALKKLVIEPYVTYLAVKGPTWIHAPADFVLWAFQMARPDVVAPAAPVATPAVPATPSSKESK